MKKFFYVMAGLAIVLLVLYTFLGGFTEPEVSVTTSKTIYVAGVPFEGSLKDEDLQGAFRISAKLLKSSELSGTLGNIYYNNPEKGADSIRAFIGVIIPDTSITLPEGYELRTVPGGRKVVHAEANADLALLPRKLYAAVFEYAEQENLKLEDFYVEWFPASDQGVVEVPVKK